MEEIKKTKDEITK